MTNKYYHKHYNEYINDPRQPACLLAFLKRVVEAAQQLGFDQEGGRAVDSRLTAYFQGNQVRGRAGGMITAGMLVLITKISRIGEVEISRNFKDATGRQLGIERAWAWLDQLGGFDELG